MNQNRQVSDLKNIGTKVGIRLNEVGIFTEEQLRLTGAVDAHKLIKKNYPEETLPICYYLYSFEGALSDLHWNGIGDQKKEQLKNQIG